LLRPADCCDGGYWRQRNRCDPSGGEDFFRRDRGCRRFAPQPPANRCHPSGVKGGKPGFRNDAPICTIPCTLRFRAPNLSDRSPQSGHWERFVDLTCYLPSGASPHKRVDSVRQLPTLGKMREIGVFWNQLGSAMVAPRARRVRQTPTIGGMGRAGRSSENTGRSGL